MLHQLSTSSFAVLVLASFAISEGFSFSKAQVPQHYGLSNSSDNGDDGATFDQRAKRNAEQEIEDSRLPKWDKLNLTYRITKYSSHLNRTATDQVLESAFEMWSNVTPLRFTRKDQGEVDFRVMFDLISFDGIGGILFRTGRPPSGRVTFDDAEDWSVHLSGLNFFKVAVHAIGHALGLRHSVNINSVMYPFRGIRLHNDDIKAIQALYGPHPSTEVYRKNSYS